MENKDHLHPLLGIKAFHAKQEVWRCPLTNFDQCCSALIMGKPPPIWWNICPNVCLFFFFLPPNNFLEILKILEIYGKKYLNGRTVGERRKIWQNRYGLYIFRILSVASLNKVISVASKQSCNSSRALSEHPCTVLTVAFSFLVYVRFSFQRLYISHENAWKG